MRGKFLRLWVVALLVVAALPLIGLSAVSAETTVTIGLSVPSLNDPFYAGMSGGAQAAAKDLGIDINVMDANNDPAVELNNVESLISAGVSALLISPVNEADSRAAVEAANQAGIPVLLVGKNLSGELSDLKIVATVSPDEQQGGWLAASVLCQSMGNTGTVVELVGDAQNAVDAARGEGFAQYMSEQCSGVTVVQLATTDLDRDAIINAFSALINGQTVNGAFAYNDQSTLAVVEAAIIARKTDISVVGFDATDDAMAALQQGRMQAIITPAGWKLGSVAVDASNTYVSGKEIPAQIQIWLGVLTNESLSMFRGGPRSGSFEGDPRSGKFEGGPGSGSFEGGPGSGSFEGGPGSGSFEGGPGSGSFEGGPGSGSFEGGPRSGSFE